MLANQSFNDRFLKTCRYGFGSVIHSWLATSRPGASRFLRACTGQGFLSATANPARYRRAAE